MKIYIVLVSYGYSHDDIEVELVTTDKEKAKVFVSNHKTPGNCNIVISELK